MKKLKYTFIAIAGLLYSMNVTAQENKISFFNSGNSQQEAPGDGTGQDDGPADEDPDPNTPINNYLPLLVIGAGLVALRYRKQLLKN